jgi:DNA-binding IclR family transcriptional regulator
MDEAGEISAVAAKTMLKGIDILDIFLDGDGGPFGLTEVSQRSGINKKSAHRLLRALAGRGLLSFDAQSGKYTLGRRLIELGFAAQRVTPIVALAAPVLDQLRDLSGESAALVLPDAAHRLYGAVSLSGQPVRWVVDAGRRHPLYVGSSGILFASERGDEEVRSVLGAGGFDAFGYPHPEEEVMAAVREARQTGSVILVHGGNELASISFAVRDAAGRLAAAVVVGGPPSRWTVARMRELRPRMKELVRELERRLGYRPQVVRAG